MSPRQVDLDELVEPGLSVVLGGEIIPVSPVDGVGVQLVAKMTKETAIEVLYKVAERCLPTLKQSAVLALTPIQVAAVVKLASEGVESVEALASPNSEPAGKRTASQRRKELLRMTPSASSSRE